MMDSSLETVNIDIDEASELLFKVKVEGVDPAPCKIRLVCEADDVGYVFKGHPLAADGVVQFLLPPLTGKLKEGVYQSRVEVLIENKYFAPVTFNINFKKTLTVVAEAVQVPQQRIVPQVTVTATPIVVEKPVPPAPPPPRKVVPPAPRPSPSTLKERYVAKREKNSDELGEDLIRELAQNFVRTRKR